MEGRGATVHPVLEKSLHFTLGTMAFPPVSETAKITQENKAHGGCLCRAKKAKGLVRNNTNPRSWDSVSIFVLVLMDTAGPEKSTLCDTKECPFLLT